MSASRRSIFIINPRFQIRFSIFMCLIVFVASIIFPLTFYDFYGSVIGQMSQNKEFLDQKLWGLIKVLALVEFIIMAIIFIVCIFISHKIAGPIYKTQKYLSAIRSGNNYGKLFFRKGDYFPELADDFTITFNQIGDEYKKDIVYLSEVSTYLSNLIPVLPEDKRPVVDQILKNLEEIQERYKTLT